MSADLSKIWLNVLGAYYYCCCLLIMFNVVMPEEVNMVVVPVFMFVSSCLIDAFWISTSLNDIEIRYGMELLYLNLH